MKAIRLHEYRGPEKLVLEEVPTPSPKEGEVLVKIAAVSVNPIDWKLRSGVMKEVWPLELPAILGHDIAGTLVQGGDRVMAMLQAGGYADYVVAKRSDLAPIPTGLDDVQAAALPMVLLTGAQVIENAIKVEKGWTVLVTGALGGVGRAAVYAAKARGAKVIAGVRGKQKDAAKELGADQIVALDDDAAIAALPELDAVADTVGGEAANKLVQKVKATGVWGALTGPQPAAEARGIRVVQYHAQNDAKRLEELAKDVAAGKLKIHVEKTFPLADASKAHELGQKGGVAKLVLKP